MNRAVTNQRIAEASRFQTGIACLYYLLIIITAVVILFLGSKLGFLVDLVASAFYVGVTALFYALTRPS